MHDIRTFINICEGKIANPIGRPPANINEFHQIFSDIEDAFTDFTGSGYIQALHDLHNKYGSVQEVSIKDLIPIEETVDIDYIKELQSGQKTPSKLPLVYLYDGKLFLMDGNHQTAARLLAGDSKIKVNVVDLSKIRKMIS